MIGRCNRRTACGEHEEAVTGHVEGAGGVLDHRVLQHVEQVVLVQELEARVESEHHRDHRQPEVRRHRTRHVGPDHVGATQQGHPAVRSATGEPAHVALDLRHILGVAGARRLARLHVLGEHRGVAAAGAVDRGGRLHHQVPHAGRLLAGGQQLHRPDDVELLHGVATTGGAGRGDHTHVDDRVDVLPGDHLGDHRVADVGAHERHVADITPRGYDVHSDHAPYGGVGREGAREAPPQITGDSRDEDDLSGATAAHGRALGPAGVTCRACDAGRASSSEACGASSWPYACAAS